MGSVGRPSDARHTANAEPLTVPRDDAASARPPAGQWHEKTAALQQCTAPFKKKNKNKMRKGLACFPITHDNEASPSFSLGASHEVV